MTPRAQRTERLPLAKSFSWDSVPFHSLEFSSCPFFAVSVIAIVSALPGSPQSVMRTCKFAPLPLVTGQRGKRVGHVVELACDV